MTYSRALSDGFDGSSPATRTPVALKTIAIENYRSLKDVAIELGQLTVITGPNGSGKSNIYRALGLIHQVIQDGALGSLAVEGGLQNVLHAGERSNKRVSLRLGVALEELNYAIDLGLPQLGPFPLDPEVKSEVVWHGDAPRPSSILAQRSGQSVTLVDNDGRKVHSPWAPRAEESMIATLTDPEQTPELYRLREQARGWLFYDNLRVDAQAPARLPSPSTFTPILDPSGANFPAALATVLRVGEAASFHEAVSTAFEGAHVDVLADERGIARVAFDSGLRRPLDATELSDGTLRFLLLATLLHSPRPGNLLVLNEPEASLHPNLIPALAQMIRKASHHTQVIVVSHSQALAEALQASAHTIELTGSNPTAIVGQTLINSPRWTWPANRK